MSPAPGQLLQAENSKNERAMISPPLFLLAFANDRDDRVRYLRNLPEELREIKQKLEEAKAYRLCDYICLPNATLKEILDTFQKVEYRNRIAVLHYGGHANSLQLLLETKDGRIATADARGLASFLGQQLGLELVFLNGCSTQEHVEALLNANVPMVIATSQAIDDQVAKDFASRFYNGLANGASVQTAYSEAAAGALSAGTGNMRDLYLKGIETLLAKTQKERLPWQLYFRQGAEAEGHWNLPDAAENPLFGLPSIPPSDLPDEPFRHLSAFTREHAEIFFGRSSQIRELYDRVTEPSGAPIVLVYGQAGVGKSSLLDAGLAPRIESSHKILYLRRNHTLGLLQTTKLGIWQTKEAEMSLSSLWRKREEHDGKPLVLILDQVEEVFTRPNPDSHAELELFFNAVEEIFSIRQSRPQGRLILGFRKEWESEIEQKLREHKLHHEKLFLQPLDRRGITEAATGVTSSSRLQRQYGLEIKDGVPELISHDLSSDPDSPTAPTLQILMTKMWAEAKRTNNASPVWSLALYQRLKKQGILLGDFLDQQLSKLKEEEPEAVNSGLALDVLAYHTTPLGTAEQRTDSQIKQEYNHQLQRLSQLLDKLKELYLIADPAQDQVHEVSAKATRLAHDTLAPLVRVRYDKSVLPGQRARRILENRSRDWQEGKLSNPLDDHDLAAVETGASGMRHWSSDELRFIKASRDARTRRVRRKIGLRIAGVAVVVLIVASAGFAWWQREKAIEAQQQAFSRQLLAHANLLRTSPLSVSFIQSVLLNVEAQRRFSSSESNIELSAALGLLSQQLAKANTGGAISALRFTPDGKYLGVVRGNQIQVRDIISGQSDEIKARLFTEWNGHDIAFSSDGKYLAVGTGETREKPYGNKTEMAGAAIVWDWQRNEQVAKIKFRRSVQWVSFVDAKATLIASDNLTVKLIDLDKNPNREMSSTTLTQAEMPSSSIAISSDNRFLAVGAHATATNPHVTVFDLTAGKQIHTFREGNSTGPLALNRDGTKLAIGSTPAEEGGTSLRLVNLKTGKGVVTGLTGRVSELVFSPNGEYLAVHDDVQGILRVLDSWGKDVIAPVANYSPRSGRNTGLFFFPDSQRIIVFNGRSAARVFRISSEIDRRPMALEVLRMASEELIDVAALSADGEYFAAGSANGLLTIWKTRSVLEFRDIAKRFRNPNYIVDTKEPDQFTYAENNQITDRKYDQYISRDDTCFFSPKGNYIILNSIVGRSYITNASDGRVLIQPDKNAVILFSEDDAYMSVSDANKGTIIRELATNREIALDLSVKGVKRIELSPEKSNLFILSEYDTSREVVRESRDSVTEVDLKSGKVSLLEDFSPRAVSEISPGAEYFLSITEFGFEIFDRVSRKKMRLEGSDRETFFDPNFSVTGKYLTASGEETVNIWEVATGRLLDQVAIRNSNQNEHEPNLTFDPGDKLLALWFDNEVQILNLQTRQKTRLINEFNLTKVVFSPDSTYLATLDERNTIRLRRLPEGTQESIFNGTFDIADARFSDDGNYLVLLEKEVDKGLVVSELGTRLVSSPGIQGIHALSVFWNPTAMTNNVCQWLPRNLMQDEWRKYFGDIPYTKTCPNLR